MDQNLATMDEYEKGLMDYLNILRRRKGLILSIMSLILATSIAFALGLPATYKSEATILIEQQEVPQDFVRSLVTSFAEQRIQVIKQKILSTRNLMKHIEKYGLYSQERKVQSIDTVVKTMRENIELEMINANVVDPTSGRARTATIAFSVSFIDKSPKIAQTITNELVTLFLNENIKNRAESAIEASAFLATEGDKLRNTIATLEGKLAEFKEKNAKTLPELAPLNLQIMHRLEQEILEVKRVIGELQERKVYLAAELSQQPEVIDEQLANPNYIPQRPSQYGVNPDSRLELLQTEYTAAISKYSAGHPDVARLKREISSLQSQVGSSSSDTIARDNRINDLQLKLSSARERYSADHPDIRRYERELSTLEHQRTTSTVKIKKRKLVSPYYFRTRQNPAYVQLKAQLEAAGSEAISLREKIVVLEAKHEDYTERLSRTPQVEREYKNLVRDYESASAKYKDITAKELEAQLAQSLESERKGERFTLIEPPLLPEEPFKPNRIAIAFLGFIFSLAGGIGAASVAEVVNDSVRGRHGVLEILGEAPLAVVPYIVTAADNRKKMLQRSLFTFGTLATLVIACVLVHFYVMPLDVLWFRSLRRLGL